MNIKTIVITFLILLHAHAFGIITYQFSGGRFGDNLLSYAHAQWIAYLYNTELLYKPFEFSDQLMLHHQAKLYSAREHPKKTTINLHNYKSLIFGGPQLIEVPYYSEYPNEPRSNLHGLCLALTVDWKNPEFKAILKTNIKPARQLDHIIIPPHDCISVALHLRKGGRADGPHAHLKIPLKFPPTSFFAAQLKMICQKYPDNKIYVFVFTDDLNVEKLKQELTQDLHHNELIIESREITSDTDFVLDDFFSLPHFNILVRPCSNFSFIAGKLGNYLLEIAPKAYSKKNNIIYITEVEIHENVENNPFNSSYSTANVH